MSLPVTVAIYVFVALWLAPLAFFGFLFVRFVLAERREMARKTVCQCDDYDCTRFGGEEPWADPYDGAKVSEVDPDEPVVWAPLIARQPDPGVTVTALWPQGNPSRCRGDRLP